MFTLIFTLLALMAWCLPGLYIARGLYSRQMREIARQGGVVVPPKPERPRITLNEMLHVKEPAYRQCGLHKPMGQSCSCRYREDWIELKNAWMDYDEWVHNYGHVKNGVTTPTKPKVAKCYAAVPFWPIFLGVMFIQGGAERIPNYREIERIEQELKDWEIEA